MKDAIVKPANETEKRGGVLVVDDEPGMREGCRWVLASEGYAVELATNGDEGLERLQSGCHEVALIDLKMPGMDGLQLLKLARERAPDTICIVVTGYATLDTAVEATKIGAYDFISKPFTPEELISCVRRAQERRRLLLEAKRLRQEMERSMLHLSTEKSRLRSVIHCMVDGVLVTNRESQLVLTNPAALRLLRLKGENTIGRRITGLGLARDLTSLLVSPPGESGTEMVVRELDTGAAVLMANVAPIRDDAGEIVGAVAVLRDITELKQLDRLKNQFVRMVAHELRAPLGAISQYLDVLTTGAVAGDPERQGRMLNRCQERTTSLLTLIDDLLDLSSIESGKVARNVEQVQVAAIIADTVEVFRAQAGARGIEIVLEVQSDLPAILADRRDLTRVFTNLLSNAIKYNREGGRVEIKVARDDGRLRIDFRDTGHGIPEEAMGHLFEEFFRVTMHETERVTGTGLGLSIVRRLLDAYHGYVTVESTLGAGSVFSVFLPIIGSGAPSEGAS